jgi:hypothetical protein
MRADSTIGMDLAKSVFQMLHSGDASGVVLFRRRLRRDQLLASSRSGPPARWP